MASCLKCIALFPRSARPVAASFRSRASAAGPLTFLKTTGTRNYSNTTAVHSQTTLLLQRHILAVSSPARQLRFNSSAAVAAVATDSTPVSATLKIHNPQHDESGKELTVDITDNAVKQLKHIAARDQKPLQGLRITVDSGGCHGYQYLMDLTEEINEDDVVFDKDGGRVIIDTITLPMISGSRIDFIEELIGSAFKVLANPHAAHSCGCDTSFEIKI